MDYEKKYKEALARAKTILKRGYYISGDIEVIFPELAESEDERIRKAISQCVEDMRGQFEKLYSVHHKDAIAWLEKQGEENPLKGTLGDVFDDLRAGLDPSPKQEWSEEDEQKISDILALLRGGENCHYNTSELFNWLKSLRPQNRWKPSDEQIEMKKLGEIARHIIAVKQHIEDMRLSEDEWSLLEKIGYPEQFRAKQG